MHKRLIIFTVVLLIVGCGKIRFFTTPPPPPGWNIPVSDLFIDISDFPKNWAIDFSDPKDKQNDPTINHVFREWTGQGFGRTWQSIWRAYSISDAKILYGSLRESQFVPKVTLHPDTAFDEFSPPDQISFTSQTADEYYFACGVWRFPYCEVVARYRNYVTNVHLPLETIEINDVGLTNEQIEVIIKGMDQQFIVFFKSIGQ